MVEGSHDRDSWHFSSSSPLVFRFGLALRLSLDDIRSEHKSAHMEV